MGPIGGPMSERTGRHGGGRPRPRHVPWPRTQRVLAAVLAVGAVLGFFALLHTGSPRSWIRTHYTQQSHSGGSEVLTSPDSVTSTARQIRTAWKPAEELVDPSGVFLRYHDLIVAIVPKTTTGSTIYLEDEKDGYAHWYPYVGGSWGTGSPVDGTRGGGPGSGK